MYLLDQTSHAQFCIKVNIGCNNIVVTVFNEFHLKRTMPSLTHLQKHKKNKKLKKSFDSIDSLKWGNVPSLFAFLLYPECTKMVCIGQEDQPIKAPLWYQQNIYLIFYINLECIKSKNVASSLINL